MADRPDADDHLLPTRMAHLNMIQAIVTRLAGFSASAKNVCIVAVAAIIGASFQQGLPMLLGVGALVIIVFGALDTYYLAQERRFRKLYGDVANRPLGDARKLDLAPPKLTIPNYLEAAGSFSTGGFYVLLLVMAGLMLYVAHGRTTSEARDLGDGAGASAQGQHEARSPMVAGSKNPAGPVSAPTPKQLPQLPSRKPAVRNADKQTIAGPHGTVGRDPAPEPSQAVRPSAAQ